MPQEETAYGNADDGRETALFDHLARYDEPCPKCGYSLRHLRAARCPECGRPLRLGVHTAREPLGWWTAAVSGLVPGAGIGLLILVMLPKNGWPPMHPGMFVLCALSALSLLLLPLAVWRRNGFTRRPRGVQAAMAVCCLAIGSATLVVCALFIK